MNSNVTRGKLVLNSGHSVYEGEILDGKATGKGLLRWDDGENWEGMFIDGMPNGQCRRFWDDGMYVEGVFKNAQPVGDVKLFQPGVGLFEGPFDGNGAGKMTYPDGSFYEGEFVDRQPNGWGKSVTPGQYEIEGEWRNGEPLRYSIIENRNEEKTEQLTTDFFSDLMAEFEYLSSYTNTIIPEEDIQRIEKKVAVLSSVLKNGNIEKELAESLTGLINTFEIIKTENANARKARESRNRLDDLERSMSSQSYEEYLADQDFLNDTSNYD